MGWATDHVQKLLAGETVKFRPKGSSMKGKVESGQLCTVQPINGEDLVKGDIVLCKVKGNYYLHLISAILEKEEGDRYRYQISNNRGYVNGWIDRNCIFGKLIRVEK